MLLLHRPFTCLVLWWDCLACLPGRFASEERESQQFWASGRCCKVPPIPMGPFSVGATRVMRCSVNSRAWLSSLALTGLGRH